MKIRIIKSAKNKKSHYTQVLNEIAQNNNLTLEEKGLMLYFLSLPEDWKINKVKRFLNRTLILINILLRILILRLILGLLNGVCHH
jgi:hypothetical protein